MKADTFWQILAVLSEKEIIELINRLSAKKQKEAVFVLIKQLEVRKDSAKWQSER